MDRHVLLTISDDYSCLHGVRFVTGFFDDTRHLRLTLLYVATSPKTRLTQTEIAKDYDNLSKREAEAKNQAQAALDHAEELLIHKHFPKENIHKKITFKQFGTAGDIIQEGITGMYDAIALGRRGLTRLEEFLGDSVSRQLISTPLDIPLWICRDQKTPCEHVLLCTDGSPASLRCADHVGFMLKDEPRHQITLLHVPTHRSTAQAQEILTRTRRMLEENGIPTTRMSERIITDSSPAEAILRLAREEKYALLATGRTGLGETHSQHLLGSVSMFLVRNLDVSTLWVVH